MTSSNHHADRDHAILSASASSRWIRCPASIRMEKKAPPKPESMYAREGTAAHELAEIRVQHELLKKISLGQRLQRIAEWRREQEKEEWFKANPAAISEMTAYVNGFIEYVEERLTSAPNGILFVEQHLSSGLPESWGTSDIVIVWPDTVEIIDLKYGAGVRVDAEGNSQLRIYALGALDEFGDLIGDTKHVRMTVYQPRLEHISTEELTADELREWREEIRPIAERALTDDAEFNPSLEACRWCPAAGICRARMRKETEADFGQDPDVLSLDEMSGLLHQIPSIRDWLNAIEKTALDLTFSQGKTIPGWKVVRSGGRRVIKDVDAAFARLTEAGLREEDILTHKLATLGNLDKAVKELGTSLEDILGDVIEKSDGRESLVPEDDPREAISPESGAAADFAD